MKASDDRELVKRCIGGNAEAWSEFVDRFSGLIYWAIKRKLHRCNCLYLASEVEDIYQRLFASLLEKKSLNSVSERSNISPWLIVLASNLTIDYIRRKIFEERYLRQSFEAQTKFRDEKSYILNKEGKELLDEAVKLLSEKEKTYLELSLTAGKKHKEIAEIFNTSINSVSTIIARARNKIRSHIESKDKKV